MTTIGIFGTGSVAREAGDIVHALGWSAIYIAHDEAERLTWTGSEPIVLQADVDRYRDHGCVIGIGAGQTRERLATHFAGVICFANLVHPDASFGRNQRAAVDARHGAIVYAGARLSNNVGLGNFVVINPNATIGHDTIVDDFVTICPGANVSGNVHIKTRAWIGAGAVIKQGSADRKLVIGADALIGLGSVVIEDCEAGGTYAGVPARKIR